MPLMSSLITIITLKLFKCGNIIHPSLPHKNKNAFETYSLLYIFVENRVYATYIIIILEMWV